MENFPIFFPEGSFQSFLLIFNTGAAAARLLTSGFARSLEVPVVSLTSVICVFHSIFREVSTGWLSSGISGHARPAGLMVGRGVLPQLGKRSSHFHHCRMKRKYNAQCDWPTIIRQ